MRKLDVVHSLNTNLMSVGYVLVTPVTWTKTSAFVVFISIGGNVEHMKNPKCIFSLLLVSAMGRD